MSINTQRFTEYYRTLGETHRIEIACGAGWLSMAQLVRDDPRAVAGAKRLRLAVSASSLNGGSRLYSLYWLPEGPAFAVLAGLAAALAASSARIFGQVRLVACAMVDYTGHDNSARATASRTIVGRSVCLWCYGGARCPHLLFGFGAV